MSSHVPIDEAERWRSGAMPPAQVVEVARHIGSCADCSARAEAAIRVEVSARAVRAQLEEEHPDLDAGLAAYVEGRLSPPEHAEVARHLRHCTRCREDVADLGVAPPRRWRAAALAAAASVAAVMTVVMWKREPMPLAPPTSRSEPASQGAVPQEETYARREWSELVTSTRRGARMELPAVVAAIRRRPDVLRGSPSAERPAVAPAGVVVESDQPELTWVARRGARSRVTIFAGERQLLRSEPLSGSRWLPPRPLGRGTTYTWEVEIDLDGGLYILPQPPAPPLQFHVVSADALSEIDAARRTHPDDHLLLGLLYARAGLAERAREELLRTGGSDRAVARRVVQDLESWNER